MSHFIKAGSWIEKRKGLKGELDLDWLISTVVPSPSGGGDPSILVESGSSEKISAMAAATDLTGAVVPVVQGGVNKKADGSLFVLNGANDSAVEILTQTENLQTYYAAYQDEGVSIHSIDTTYQTQAPNIYNTSSVYLEASSTASSATIQSTGSIKIRNLPPEGGSTDIIVIDENGNILMPNLPTSASGLTAGMLWNDNGTLKIVLP
jgi:hypothetical protein